MNCHCDYERPEFYVKKNRTARRQHRCDECRALILPKESYELVTAKWDGSIGKVKTCSNCIALREYVQAHVPCFCWVHHNLKEDAIETARHWNREAPGLLFGAYRYLVKSKRKRLATR